MHVPFIVRVHEVTLLSQSVMLTRTDNISHIGFAKAKSLETALREDDPIAMFICNGRDCPVLYLLHRFNHICRCLVGYRILTLNLNSILNSTRTIELHDQFLAQSVNPIVEVVGHT